MVLLDDNEIHLWTAELDRFTDGDSQRICDAMLSDDERCRSRKFCFEHHRQRFLATRGIIRSVLSKYCKETNPKDWRFTFGSQGKPGIDAPSLSQPLHFNISHSKNRIGVAVARYPGIGVDIEFISAQRGIIKIAERYFSPTEVDALLSLSTEQQLSRFYDLWTLKESYIKACGSGLIIPLRHFAFGFPQNGEINFEFDHDLDEKPEDWNFWQFDDGINYRLALALKSTRYLGNYRITARELLSFSEDTASGIQLSGMSQRQLSNVKSSLC